MPMISGRSGWGPETTICKYVNPERARMLVSSELMLSPICVRPDSLWLWSPPRSGILSSLSSNSSSIFDALLASSAMFNLPFFSHPLCHVSNGLILESKSIVKFSHPSSRSRCISFPSSRNSWLRSEALSVISYHLKRALKQSGRTTYGPNHFLNPLYSHIRVH